MLKYRDIKKAKSRKKLWDLFGFTYLGKGLNYLSRNHSLNCGCGCCREKTHIRKNENKRNRLKNKQELKTYCNGE